MMVCRGGGKGERKNERIITSMSVNSGGQLVIVLVIVVIVGWCHDGGNVKGGGFCGSTLNLGQLE